MSAVKDLLIEYLEWATENINREFNLSFDSQEVIEEELAKLDDYLPPEGSIILVQDEAAPAGVGFLREIDEGEAEIKRMYVRQDFRGRGLGRKILQALLARAEAAGYSKVRLDSANFMQAAHSMYRSEGFVETDHYPESQVPTEFQENWVFMEKEL